MSKEKIFQEGKNCWRMARAQRVSFLIDAASYFSTLKTVLEKARHSIFILAWDIDSQLRLTRDGNKRSADQPLVQFLNGLASKQKGLHIYVLAWDFAIVYALEREWLPVYKMDWKTHRRMKFRLDGNQPVGGAHHQKIVVVDDSIAFSGGIDLCKARWDTPEHKIDDPRRVDSEGKPFPPFHDLQMIVEGEAARYLGELARIRWFRATGERISPSGGFSNFLWPKEIEPDFENVDIGIALTQPLFGEIGEMRQVETLYMDSIRMACRYIYIENQYFTSNAVGEALVRRLQEREGPEVVLVLPKKTSGWLEQNTMDVLRYRLLKRIRSADRHGRLRIYYPELPGSGEGGLNVHGKVFIADDRFVRVGSSNLSNRSMGLDTECDLAIEGIDQEGIQKGIAGIRNRLIGEHLGVEPARVGQVIEAEGSLIRSIESLRGGARTFKELDGSVPAEVEQKIPDSAVLDPERPIDPERLIDLFIPKDQIKPAAQLGLRFAFLVSFIVVLIAAWFLTPLRDWLNAEQINQWIEISRGSPYTFLFVPGLFMVASVVGFPITLVLVGTILVFGTVEGFMYSWVGCLLGAAASYQVGHFLGRDLIRRYAGKKVNTLSQWLARRGILTMATLRIVPVAPYTVINMVAGASHIRFRDYMLGTLIGLTPGLMAMTIGLDRLIQVLRHPGPGTFAILGIVILAIGLGAWGLRTWAIKKRERG